MAWEPRGPIVVILIPTTRPSRGAKSAKEDRIESWGEGGLTARLFVGLNVGDVPTYTIDNVVAETRDFRLSRKQSPDSSFIAQKGLYTDRTGHLVDENSVQIIIFADPSLQMAAFREQMEALAKHLRRKFDQNSVIVELQDRGIVQQVFAVER